jgi:SNF2 family DNA or RNA helicase
MTLWQHQQDALEFIDATLQASPGVLIAAGMGSGKSYTAIAALQQYKRERVLVLAPKSVVNNVWHSEFTQWGPEFHVLELGSGSVKKRCELLQSFTNQFTPFAIVVNYDVVYRKEMLAALMQVGFDSVILDECHRIASPGAATSKSVRKLAEDIPMRLGLTGTPLSSSMGPLAIWGQAKVLSPGAYQRTYSAFKTTYSEPCSWGMHDGASPLGRGGTVQPWRYANQEDLQARMSTFAFRVESKDVLDLPPETDLVRTTALEPKARRIYSDLVDDLLSDLDEGTVTASNVLVRMLRLQQVTGGSLKTDDGLWAEVSEAKAKLLADVLKDLPVDRPVVVVGRFHKDLDTIAAVAHTQNRDTYELSGRQDELRRWKHMCATKKDVASGKAAPVLVVQIQAGGVGISVAQEADTLIFYSPDFSLTLYEQMRARIHRPGQDHPVTFVHLTVSDTIDEDLYRALQAKADTVKATLAGLRRS